MIKYFIYPLTFVCMYSILWFLSQQSIAYNMKTAYIGITAATLVTFFELKFPYFTKWFPQKKDIVSDFTFMLLVQIILPFLLSLGFLALLREFGWIVSIWPSHLPLWMQTLLLLVSSEFLRYWLHRAAHNWSILWRFHAVHHAPDKLYWLNVGRFHPLEKFAQYLLDTLPFLIMGVGEELLGCYFVFYAVNGFFQHSNVDVRLGPLNYLVSGPELHRWHHSRVIKEANHNYGNNLIIWDLVFGTWYFPKDHSVGELGVQEPGYRESFLALMKRPFETR